VAVWAFRLFCSLLVGLLVAAEVALARLGLVRFLVLLLRSPDLGRILEVDVGDMGADLGSLAVARENAPRWISRNPSELVAILGCGNHPSAVRPCSVATVVAGPLRRPQSRFPVSAFGLFGLDRRRLKTRLRARNRGDLFSVP